VSGSTATYQRSLLSADRAPDTTYFPSPETSGIDQRTSRSAFLPAVGGWLGPSALAAAGSSTGGAKLASAHTDLPVLRFSTASSTRFCASPTAVRPGMSSV
jgi:hypothetical protein